MASQELRRDISTAPPIDIRRIWKLREEQNCPVPSGLSVSWLFGMKGGFPFQKTKMMTGWKQTPPFEDEDGLEFPAYHVSFQGCIFFLFGGETKKGSRLFTFLAVGQCGSTTCRCFFDFSDHGLMEKKGSYQILSFHKSISKDHDPLGYPHPMRDSTVACHVVKPLMKRLVEFGIAIMTPPKIQAKNQAHWFP